MPTPRASPKPTRIHVVTHALPRAGPTCTAPAPPVGAMPGRGDTGTVGTPRPSVGSASGSLARSLSTSHLAIPVALFLIFFAGHLIDPFVLRVFQALFALLAWIAAFSHVAVPGQPVPLDLL